MIFLHWIAIGSLVLAVAVLLDELKHPQHMWIMNVVWPLTALFGSVLWLWAYFRYGRLATHEQMDAAKKEGRKPPSQGEPFAATVGKGTSHCGAGCTLGDLCAEWLAFLVPTVAVWFGWRWAFAEKTFAVWVLDYIFAYVFGIVFQYFAIAPMRGLGFSKGLWAAIKADTLSLTAWQIGMYGFMAFANLYLFGHLLGTKLEVSSPEFWFLMQIAMLCGFVTAYPVNWWLIRAGLKEKM